MAYMCTNFSVDSSSRFPFRVWTNRQTDRQTDKQTRLNALPTTAAIQLAWVKKAIYSDKMANVAEDYYIGNFMDGNISITPHYLKIIPIPIPISTAPQWHYHAYPRTHENSHRLLIYAYCSRRMLR